MDILDSPLRSENVPTAALRDWVHLRISFSMNDICPGFTQIQRLGEGGFGVVYLAKRQSDDEVRFKRHR